MHNIVNYEMDGKSKPQWLNTEYKPEYCKYLCDYAYNKFDIDGFYGEFNISPVAARDWLDIHEDWADAVMMAEYKKRAGLNNHFSNLLEYSRGIMKQDPKTKVNIVVRPPDFDLMQKVLFKMSDNNLKIEKDTGALKRRGIEEAKKNKSKNNGSLDSTLANQIAEEINKQTNYKG